MDALEREADACAARGDVAGAERLLTDTATQDPTRIDVWVKLASVRRALGDHAGAEKAIAAALRLDPLHFMALMSQARLLELSGRTSDAGRTYLRAIAQLPEQEPVPPHLVSAVDHARRVGNTYVEGVAATWRDVIDDVPGLTSDMRRRLDRFSSNALHQTRVFHSAPTHYHYPGLPEREFHDRASFPWLEQLEAQTEAIRDEYLALLQHDRMRAEPYVQYQPGQPVRQWAALNHSADWTAFHLLRNGQRVSANADACPLTLAAIDPVDQPRVAGRSPNAMFSLLKAHTRIPPHTGVANTRLVCHLPLIIPDNCRYRVGAETRPWRVGEAFVFDDTIEHEAINDSDEPRVVFIFDLWHPALSMAERLAVGRLMEAEDAGDGAPL
ncbi:hypothetical protein ASG29_09300 [Sphingomonas sp. Leaf412]|uniref:aspartyl/asparaginyl beta-hydroxylase domain-containing protein n=1 Tax=Sphingomonas sp. Leaf412 TaxID=1736370 RepID=UPI0006F919ED|nr:aspartyl/asparaginyl beta-hydroxylase domain-containing protein [Sphingomonas sp. Leaf412]KQT32041.1 hypothetical protein ASG29_09300 [Sphingomonas sp. Leaf412]